MLDRLGLKNMQFGSGIIQNGWQEAELLPFLGWGGGEQTFVMLFLEPTHRPTQDNGCYPKTNCRQRDRN